MGHAGRAQERGDYESMIYGVSVKLPDPDAYAYYLGGDSSYWAKPRLPRRRAGKAAGRRRAQTDVKARQPIYHEAENASWKPALAVRELASSRPICARCTATRSWAAR